MVVQAGPETSSRGPDQHRSTALDLKQQLANRIRPSQRHDQNMGGPCVPASEPVDLGCRPRDHRPAGRHTYPEQGRSSVTTSARTPSTEWNKCSGRLAVPGTSGPSDRDRQTLLSRRRSCPPRNVLVRGLRCADCLHAGGSRWLVVRWSSPGQVSTLSSALQNTRAVIRLLGP